MYVECICSRCSKVAKLTATVSRIAPSAHSPEVYVSHPEDLDVDDLAGLRRGLSRWQAEHVTRTMSVSASAAQYLSTTVLGLPVGDRVAAKSSGSITLLRACEVTRSCACEVLFEACADLMASNWTHRLVPNVDID